MNKMKKALAFLLAMLLLVTGDLQGWKVQAAQSGDYEYQVINDGERGVEITGYTGSGGDITIPSEIEGIPVTAIGESAFSDLWELESITIPSGVMSIGTHAFSECHGLKSVDIPEGVEIIAEGAFSGCHELRNVPLPESIKTIDDYAFFHCIWLSKMVFPKGLKSIGARAFEESGMEGSITISEGVESVGEKAFYRCAELERVIFSGGVKTIGQYAFGYSFGGYDEEGKENAKKNPDFLIYGNSGTAAETYAAENGFLFNPPELLYKESEDGSGVTITGYRGNGGELTIPSELEGKKVTGIGSMAFANGVGSSLTSLTIEEGVKIIDAYAFAGCTNLKSVRIPASVTSIEGGAFRDCSSLEDIEIPQNIKDIDGSAFEGTLWLENKRKQNPLVVVNEVLLDGKSCTGSVTIPEGVAIAESAFSGCAALLEVTIPGNIKSIGNSAFSGCSSLTKVNIQNGVALIGERVFASSGIESISIPGNVREIGASAFSDCRSLTNAGIADGVEVIGAYAFMECALKSVTIPASVKDIGSMAIGYEVNNMGMYSPIAGFVICGMSGTAAEKYAGDNGFTFKSLGALSDISRADVTLGNSSFIYDGKAKKPSVTVKLNGKTLAANTDYTVSYSNNIKPGTAKVTVTGRGKYTGTIVKTFTIKDKQGITCKKKAYNVVYGAKPFKINAASANKLTYASSDKKVAVVGKSTGKVTVKGCGLTTITVRAGKESVKVSVTVSPKRQTVTSAKAPKGGRKLTVKWKKDKKATGYQVQVSTDKKFKKIAQKQKVTKNTKDSCTFTKLKAGKKYYVRVCSYKKSGKKLISGAWSKTKTVTVKK